MGRAGTQNLAYAPVLLGFGECLLAGMNLLALGYQVNAYITTATSTHVTIAKKYL